MLSIVAMVGSFCFVGLSWAEDWAQFRGPDGSGITSETQLPTEWGPEANIKWKIAVPGFGWSQPIAVGDRLYVTTAITENQQRPQSGGFGGRSGPPPGGGKGGFPPGGKGGFPPGGEGGFRRGGDGAQPEGKGAEGKGGPPGKGGRGGFGGGAPPNAVYQWKLFCLDRGTGKVLWERLAHEGKPTIGIQPSNTYPQRRLVTFGGRGEVAFRARRNRNRLPAFPAIPGVISFQEPRLRSVSPRKPHTIWPPAARPCRVAVIRLLRLATDL